MEADMAVNVKRGAERELLLRVANVLETYAYPSFLR